MDTVINNTDMIKNGTIMYDGQNKLPDSVKCCFHGNCLGFHIEIFKSQELEDNWGSISIHIHGGGKLFIGKNLQIRGDVTFELCPESEIIIGNNALLAHNVQFVGMDYHSIYDKTSKVLLNPVKPIIVGDNCWIARDVLFLKGAGIGNNSVVACRSLVTKRFNDENILLGGAPAKILKSNIEWK